MQEKEIYKQALFKWGHQSQILMFVEEASELMQLLSKSQRQNCDVTKEEIAKEVADVEIMVGQLKFMFGVEGLVKAKKEVQLKKLKSYLDKY